MIWSRLFAGCLVATLTVFGAATAQGGADAAARVQAAFEGWLAQRAPIEGVTGIAAYISLGDPGPPIEAFAGKVGRELDDPPVDQDTLFHMGSTSKAFAAAVILKLEADGKLSLDDTVGEWLPQYPAWADVSVRRLLNVTSGIPNYSETELILEGLGRRADARSHRRGAGERRLSHRHPRSSGDDGLSLLEHELHSRRDDRGEGRRQALSGPRA